jgi:PPOX class probable F420-dependent enzyme
MRARVAGARLAHLATVAPPVAEDRGPARPHVVPCCFAIDPLTDRIYTLVDDVKAKSTVALRRLANVRANPRVALLVDHYDDRDWEQLWWIRVDGSARVVEEGPDHERAAALLAGKYEQYARYAAGAPSASSAGAAIVVDVERWTAWP